jgi:DNA-binding transcriptional LysR family regulator
LDIHILQVFSSVYRNKSFSRASEELNLTQPTVSEHIKNLEDELGVTLFDRVGRQVIPTKEADHLHAKAVEIIQKLRDLKTDIGRLKGPDHCRGQPDSGGLHRATAGRGVQRKTPRGILSACS